MFGSWFFPFWHDEWNILDFVVVGVSFVGYILKGPAVAVIRLVAAPLSALLLLCQPLCTVLLYLHAMYTHDSRLEAPAPQAGVLCAKAVTKARSRSHVLRRDRFAFSRWYGCSRRCAAWAHYEF